MRWLVTGAGGMLGRDLVATLVAAGEQVTAVDKDELDITDPAAVAAAVALHDLVVNCAAWTAVDLAEEREPDAFTVNAVGPAVLARACGAAGVRLVHVSTDYVFAGDADRPYAEDAQPDPRSAYGRTKLAGEWAVAAYAPDHLVVRTAWLYGAGGPCFPRTIARVAAERGHLEVVDDQLGQPTWTRDLAAFILRLVQAEAPSGTYHGTASGVTSWFELARAAVTAAGMAAEVVQPTSSVAYAARAAASASRSAPRPSYSVLGHDGAEAAGVASIGDWRERWAEASHEVLG